MMRKENTWDGWKENPCSDEVTDFLILLQERLEWAQGLSKAINEGSSFGHSGNVLEAIRRNEKISAIKTIIETIQNARQSNCC